MATLTSKSEIDIKMIINLPANGYYTEVLLAEYKPTTQFFLTET